KGAPTRPMVMIPFFLFPIFRHIPVLGGNMWTTILTLPPGVPHPNTNPIPMKSRYLRFSPTLSSCLFTKIFPSGATRHIQVLSLTQVHPHSPPSYPIRSWSAPAGPSCTGLALKYAAKSLQLTPRFLLTDKLFSHVSLFKNIILPAHLYPYESPT